MALAAWKISVRKSKPVLDKLGLPYRQQDIESSSICNISVSQLCYNRFYTIVIV